MYEKKKLNIKKFTLIELIIVIVVIGVLAGMALPKFIGTIKDAKISAMDQDLDVLEKAVMLYESNNDGSEPFLKDSGGNYAKVSITRQTLKDTLDAIGDDESQVYTLDMDSLKPYLERLKYTDTTTDTYLYSTKTGVAINEQGKIDSSGITHHILNGLNITPANSITNPSISLMNNSLYSSSSFVVINSNILYGWGHNSNGQLGDGTTVDKLTPTKITLPNGVKQTQISCGYDHSLAIGSDGELYAWGSNWTGQLGDGTTDTKLTPTKISLANGVKPTQISCGYEYSMAIGSDGELYTWGENSYNQLGDGTQTDRYTPTKISLPNGIKPTQISCGYDTSMAIGSDGELYGWGYNYRGQLGDGTQIDKSTPIKITLSNGVKTTKAFLGIYHSMAIGSDGELYTWGYNGDGELGDGTTTKKLIPTKITLPNEVKPKQIACGSYQSMAIGDDGYLYLWGNNDWGQLGDGTNNNHNLTPTQLNFSFK